MKRFSFIFLTLLFSCHKQQANVVYDSHLFAEIAAHTWIFDSDKMVRAGNTDTTIYSTDTALQTAVFNPQQYIVKIVTDSTTVDSTVYQITYDDPDKIYYYANGGTLLLRQYFTIDTVNNSYLILKESDTSATLSSLIYYHAQ